MARMRVERIARDSQGRLLPTGTCWCGCGGATSPGNFWAPGHDKRAEAAVIMLKHGSVAEFLVHEGFGPGRRNPQAEFKAWRSRGGQTR